MVGFLVCTESVAVAVGSGDFLEETKDRKNTYL